jgi:peroxiredoxin
MTALARLLCLVALVTAPAFAADPAPKLLDAQGNPAGFKTLAIGDAAPDFSLPGIDGRTYSLADFSKADVLMILFTSNHCPTSHAIEERLKKLRNDFRDRSFALVAINPNHPDGLRLDELGFGEFGDSFEEMKPYAEKLGWDFPYLYDGDTQVIARAYGCLATPHVFIFDKARKLQYAGRFDDSRFPEESTVKSPDARNALEAMFANQPVPVALTKPHGCSTKWREKRASNVAAEAAWTKIPVTIEQIDAGGVAALRANPTNKFRLVNVWATWCAPCVEEFPSLVAISRQFDMRDFELVTISMDEPKHEAKAKDFLQKQGAGLTQRSRRSVAKEGRTTNHYLYNGSDQDAIVAALDSEWPGPIPHTVLIAPGGKIVWRQNGVIDPATAKAKIVEAITPYYAP